MRPSAVPRLGVLVGSLVTCCALTPGVIWPGVIWPGVAPVPATGVLAAGGLSQAASSVTSSMAGKIKRHRGGAYELNIWDYSFPDSLLNKKRGRRPITLPAGA